VTVETPFNYPSDLNASYPAAGDARSEGDDHIRGIKSVLKTTFPNVSGAVTPTHTELNYVDGVTSAIQTQLDAKANKATPAFSAYQSAAQSVPTATNTKVLLQTETFDTNSCFASSTFTPNVAGYYQFSGAVGFSSAPSNLQAMLVKNGVIVSKGAQTAANGLLYIAEVSDLIYMNGSTDYIELWTYQATGSSQDTTNSSITTRLSGFLARHA
jgi:hypothetical protein